MRRVSMQSYHKPREGNKLFISSRPEADCTCIQLRALNKLLDRIQP